MITKTRVIDDRVGPTVDHPGWEVDAVWDNPDRLGEPSAGARPTDSIYLPGWVEPEDAGAWVNTPGGSETISYSTRKLHNMCVHSRKRLVVRDEQYPVVFVSEDGPRAGIRWYITGRFRNLAAISGVYSRGIAGRVELGSLPYFTVPWGDYWRQENSGRAVQTMWPGVAAGNLSSVNFLLELKDFKHSYLNAQKIRDGLRRITRLVSMMRKTGTSRRERLALAKRVSRIASVDKVAASANLEYSFAWAPFVGDCQNIWSNLQGVTQECDRLLQHCGKALRSHYACQLEPGNTVTAQHDAIIAYSGGTPNKFGIARTTVDSPAMYHATMDYTYELPPEAAWVLKWRVTLDRLGISLDPAIAWNAYPWTFLVDWAIRVGDFIHQFRVRNVRPIVTIRGFCHSVKKSRRVSLSFQQGRTSANNAGPVILAAEENELSYIREPYQPNYYQAIQLSGITLREFSLAASLLRVRKHRRTFA